MTFSRDELSAYLDGDLPAARAEELAAALPTAPALQAELEALRSLREQARALAAASTPPARDLWPAIAARTALATPITGRRASAWLLAAALLLGALLGVGMGYTLFAPPAAAPSSGQRFLLLLHEDADMQPPGSPAELTQRIARYSAWAARLREQGALELGDKLHDGEGFLLAPTGEQARTQADGVAGLFILHAPDYDAARALARTCPHLELGGTIELRRIFDF